MAESSNPPATIDIDFTTSPGFTEFLRSQRIGLVLSTYQTGTLFFLGPDAGGKLHISDVNLKRSMGLWARGNSVYAGSLFQIWRFENILPPGVSHEGADRLYLPQVGWTTGDLDAHDLVVEDSGRLVFVNTRHSCLATVSEAHSFVPLWQPPGISALTPEDRCHLNGLTLCDGKARYATALATTDTPHGWREHKAEGGVVWDLVSDAILLDGLAMPHSPRWHDDRLWLLESGTGRFGWVDRQARRFEALAFCPGYLRGLAFYGDYALIGASLPREQSGFHDLPLDAALAARGTAAQCGVFVVDCRRGEIVHSITIGGGVQELYDLAVLPGVQRPRCIGFGTDDIHYLLGIGPREGL